MLIAAWHCAHSKKQKPQPELTSMNASQNPPRHSILTVPGLAWGQRARATGVFRRNQLGAFLLGCALLAPAAVAQAQGTFHQGASTKVAVGAGRIVSGDFNRDGKTDVATLNRTRAEISLILGNGDGTLGAARTLATPVNPIDLFITDFSANAVEDLAAIGPTIGLSRGNGAGTFGSFATTPVGVEVFTSATGDFNEDGRTDVITITGAGLRLFTSTGVRLNLLGSVIPASFAATSLVAADFNRDGHLDVAFTRFGQSTTIGVMFGNGNGTFQSMQVYITGETNLDLITGDFDRDGHPDLAVSSFSATRPLAILINDHRGGFQLPKHVLVSKPDQIASADMDHNGTTDLVILSRTLRRIEILRGNGDGTFAASADLAVTIPAAATGDFVIAQLDDDAFFDLALSVRDPGDPNVSLVSLFLNPGNRPVEGLVNLSTLLRVENGARVLTGFIVEGRPTPLLIRAIGPGLKQFGLNSALVNPNLTVLQAGTVIASNDNWSATALNRTAVERASIAAGAFSLTVGSLDAATVLTLAPGAYTIVTDATPGASGEVLIEVYRAD